MKNLRSQFNCAGDIVIYGEWAGNGIQKGVAISNIDKFFCIFSVRQVTTNEEEENWIPFNQIKNDNANRIFNILNFQHFLILTF